MSITVTEKKHLDEIRPYLAECTVLLKKDGSFPLEKPCSLALYGNGARHTEKGGMGSGEVNCRSFITIEEGLKRSGFTITTNQWLDAYDAIRDKAEKEFIRQVNSDAKAHHVQTIIESMGRVMMEPEYSLPLKESGDTCIYVLSRTSGEGGDRTLVKGDYLLTNSEVRDILALNEKYKKFMLVLNTGGPVDLTPVMACHNILLLSLLGSETGSVLADVILGKEVPSGRLAEEWLSGKDVSSIQEFGEKNDTRYLEGIYVGYRGSGVNERHPLFPFGHGISYTDFTWKFTSIQIEKSLVSIHAEVSNTGKYHGKEVLEAFISCPQDELDKPLYSLVSFTKTDDIKPGKNIDVMMSFDLRNSASFDEKTQSWILAKGNYVISISSGNHDMKPVVILHVDQTVTVRKTTARFGDCGFEDWKPERKTVDQVQDLAVYEVNSDDLKAEPVLLKEETIDPRIDALDDDTLALMNIGAFDPKGGIASIIGNASETVAGAAGDISSYYQKLCGKTLVMADGPAGLRLSTNYFKDEKGIHSMDDGMPASYVKYLSKVQRTVMHLMQKKPKKNTVIHEQYTTMIPSETAIVQTWNPEAAEVIGNVVGEEMEQFGIRLWLAPALNIQRNPLCGRNFEYLSEDPYLTYTMASGLIKGVQKHPERYVVIKHFACNNQEYNRTNNNSQVSERAMREIYLKAFEMLIRNGSIHAVMTSYNLINGIHVSESRALCTDFLRKECGFDGIIMTDWVTATNVFSKNAKYPAPAGDKVCMAGNDLFMPGSNREYKQIMEGLKSGTVTREQLKINASRVLRICEGVKDNE